MILAAARALGENSPALHDASASLLPALTDLGRWRLRSRCGWSGGAKGRCGSQDDRGRTS